MRRGGIQVSASIYVIATGVSTGEDPKDSTKLDPATETTTPPAPVDSWTPAP